MKLSRRARRIKIQRDRRTKSADKQRPVVDPALIDRANALARSLGTEIPKDINLAMWSLVILEELVGRLICLEARVSQDSDVKEPQITGQGYETIPAENPDQGSKTCPRKILKYKRS